MRNLTFSPINHYYLIKSVSSLITNVAEHNELNSFIVIRLLDIATTTVFRRK